MKYPGEIFLSQLHHFLPFLSEEQNFTPIYLPQDTIMLDQITQLFIISYREDVSEHTDISSQKKDSTIVPRFVFSAK